MTDVPWEDTFKLGASAATSEISEWVQVGIDVNIPHRKYHVKRHSCPWFSAACAAAIVHRNHFFCLHQQNKSDSKLNFRQAGNHCKSVFEAAKLAYATKTKEHMLLKLYHCSLRNLALRTFPDCFPDCWKVSLVVPVFKNVGESSTAKNYHPVSLLSVVSKVFEKLVNNRINDHLEKCGLFFDFQYCFRSSQSTTDLLTVASDRIARVFNRSGDARTVAFDISKAGLLHKLKSSRLSLQGLKAPFLFPHFSYLGTRI